MNLFKTYIIALMALLCSLSAVAQNNDSTAVESFNPRVNVKVSALAAIGIINPAVEFRISPKWSMQLEGMAVYAANNFLGTGYPLQLGSFFLEGRYYFKEVFQGFFVAPNAGFGAFRMNKNILHKFFGWAPDLDYKKPENSVQIGSYGVAGVSLGYVYTFKKNPRWAVEFNWSLGRQWARYEAYHFNDKEEVSYHRTMNGSAEWMPFYRGGIFVSYKF